MTVPALRIVRTTGEQAANDVKDHLAQVRAMEESSTKEYLQRRVYAEFVFAYWAAKTKRPKARLSPIEIGFLENRLQECGDDVSRLLFAVDGAGHFPPWKRLQQEQGYRCDWIRSIFRDNEWVERLAECVPAYGRDEVHPLAAKYLLRAAP